MQYFKNTDLAKLYPISEKAVRNWIKAAQAGHLDIALHKTAKRAYIANTPQNLAKIQQIVSERKKYSNRLTHKEILPSAKFYETYKEGDIFDIVNSIEVNREIPLQYSYFGAGARIWEDYVSQQLYEKLPSIPAASSDIFLLNKEYIEYLMRPFERINLVCIGAEVFSTLRPVLTYLSEKKQIGRVILIDTSGAMLRIAQKHMEEWFSDKILLEVVERDMRYERFHDILIHETLREDVDQTLNIFLLAGSTIYNFQSPDETLKMIHHSLGRRDIFIHDIGLDSESRRSFSLNFGLSNYLSLRLEALLNLIGIDESLYEVEKFYDDESKKRIIRVRLNVSMTICFRFNDGMRLVHLNKGECITVFRYWHQSTESTLRKLDEAGFDLLHASHTKDNQYLMTISTVGQRH